MINKLIIKINEIKTGGGFGTSSPLTILSIYFNIYFSFIFYFFLK